MANIKASSAAPDDGADGRGEICAVLDMRIGDEGAAEWPSRSGAKERGDVGGVLVGVGALEGDEGCKERGDVTQTAMEVIEGESEGNEGWSGWELG